MRSSSGNGATAPSKSSTIGRTGVIPEPLATGFETPCRARNDGAQERMAGMDGVAGERESRAQLRLDLRVRPAGDERREAARGSVLEVVHPAHAIEVVLAGIGILEADPLVHQRATRDNAQIEGDQPTVVTV